MTHQPARQGHNSLGLDQAIARLETSGFMLARLETLTMAIRDSRIDRGCLRVLAELIGSMNRETWTSWLGRDALADRCGITAKSAGNYIYQLKAIGYIVGERRSFPQAGNRQLTHYTLSALSPDELNAAITRAVDSIRGDRQAVTGIENARQDGHKMPARTGNSAESAHHDGQPEAEVPVRTGNEVPAMTGNACQDGQSKPGVPAGTGTCGETNQESARQDGCSNSNISTTFNNSTFLTSGERGTGGECTDDPPKVRPARLSDDWVLPKSWGVWALDHFEITPDQVRGEAASFRDYWTSLGNTRHAAKKDWFATWRNWVRNSRNRWRATKADEAASESLDDQPPRRGARRDQRTRGSVMTDAINELIAEAEHGQGN